MALTQNPAMWNYEDEYQKFENNVAAARQRIAVMEAPELLAAQKSETLFEELNVTMEELLVAQEEMRQQNEELVTSRLMIEDVTHRYREWFDFAPDAYFVTSRDGVIREANRKAAELLNVPQALLIGKPLVVFIDPEARREFRLDMARKVVGRAGHAEWETRLQPRHRLYIDAQFSVSSMYVSGASDELRWMARDITDRKRDEAQIARQLERIEALNKELQAERDHLEERVRERTAALEFEVAEREKAQQELSRVNAGLQRAMTEMHHRVKNNLQIVSALIDMQAQEALENPRNLRAAMQRLTIQIRTIAALHDALAYQAKDTGDAVDALPVSVVLERLLPLAQQTTNGLKVAGAFDEVMLPTERAMALAIITNELISNAAKHGGKSVAVVLRADSERATLEVCDDGPGFPPNFDGQNGVNIGLDLVNSMAHHDLNGQARYANRPEGGACARIVFPLLA